jgi:hypothetical protein|tara:strand:- start:703 stop:1332 length:630 start_codon:yes stop_codon:yes gene_type:complete
MAKGSTYLQSLKTAIATGNMAARARMAATWFRSIVERAKTALARDTVFQDVVTDAAKSGTLTGRMWLGKMYFFVYNPKHKITLPYYDMFPLVLPIERYSNGFLGINFHYLAPKDRAYLLDEIKVFVNDKTLSENARILLTYDMLRGFTKFKRAKPCLKRYLTTYMKTQFIPVLPDEWGPSIFLPVENFKKASKKMVWAESKEIYSAIRQ